VTRRVAFTKTQEFSIRLGKRGWLWCTFILNILNMGLTKLLNADRRSSFLFWAAPLTLVVLFASPSQCQYDNTRCKCVCPSPQVVTDKASNATVPLPIPNYSSSSTNRTIYINTGNPSNLCNCYTVVLPYVGNINGKEGEFCPRCDCVFESRNLGIIQFVVILVTWIISLLIIYMMFLSCLEPLLNKQRIQKNTTYQEHMNEDDESVGGGRTSHAMRVTGGSIISTAEAGGSGGGGAVVATSLGPSSSSVLNRVGHQQSKWKRQVQEQRRNIYDRHTMLN